MCIYRSLFLAFITLTQLKGFTQSPDSTSQITLKPKLGIPFGTITSLKVEIISGDNISKADQGSYLMKVVSVGDEEVSDTIILHFIDKTGDFSNEGFKLFEKVYGKETGSINSEQRLTIEKDYVGKTFTIMAYESGEFVGAPDQYFDYQPVSQTTGFHFKSYLIVVANQTDE